MKSLAAATLAAAALAGSAHAGVILAPASVSVDVGGVASSFFAIDNIIDQSGLATKYVSGVTDFDEFIALNQAHGSSLGTRWLSHSPLSSAILTFDFGQEVTLSRLALWDDRSTNVSRIRMSTPGLGVFRELAVTDVIQGISRAEVFSFKPVTTRYLTFEITGCNQVGTAQNWAGCGLNEVIFEQGVAGAVPEPATWAMMILGFGAAGSILRRRRTGAGAALRA